MVHGGDLLPPHFCEKAETGKTNGGENTRRFALPHKKSLGFGQTDYSSVTHVSP